MRAMQRYLAELIGTFWLVLCGCGSALIAANFHASGGSGGIGLVGVSLAFGLAVATMIYAIGPVSGGHMNPAVTIGMTVAGRFESKHVVPYVAAQVIGAIAAAFVLKFIVSGAPGFDAAASGFASNGFGERSPGHYSMQAAFVCEAVMTAFFVFVVLGVTDKRAPSGFAGLIIGLCLAVIHLVTIPVTGTSVNAARSTGPAIVAGGAALDQLWLFWLAPIVGAIVAAVVYPLIVSEGDAAPSLRRAAALGSDEQGVAARGD